MALSPWPPILAVAVLAFVVSDKSRGQELYFVVFLALPFALLGYLFELLCLPCFRFLVRRGWHGWAGAGLAAATSAACAAALIAAASLLSTPVSLRVTKESAWGLVYLMVVGLTFWHLGFRDEDASLSVTE